MNQQRKIITVYLFAVSLILLYGHSIRAAEGPGPQRIVSLAPSVTETLFALGFGDRLVGVTTSCDYPAEARKIPKIGGFMSPSLETIVAKRPSIVIGVSSATDPAKAREMERLGLEVDFDFTRERERHFKFH